LTVYYITQVLKQDTCINIKTKLSQLHTIGIWKHEITLHVYLGA